MWLREVQIHDTAESVMKFSARSYSPSPARRKRRSSSTFGIQSDSESGEYDSELESCSDSGDNDDSVSIVSDSSSEISARVKPDLKNLSMCVFCVIEPLPLISLCSRSNYAGRTPLEAKHIEETVAAIRSRARFNDPYEEWEKQTRRDAFVSTMKVELRFRD